MTEKKRTEFILGRERDKLYVKIGRVVSVSGSMSVTGRWKIRSKMGTEFILGRKRGKL